MKKRKEELKRLILGVLAIALIGCGAFKGKSIRYIDTEKNIDIEASVSPEEKLDISINGTSLAIEADQPEAE